MENENWFLGIGEWKWINFTNKIWTTRKENTMWTNLISLEIFNWIQKK